MNAQRFYRRTLLGLPLALALLGGCTLLQFPAAAPSPPPMTTIAAPVRTAAVATPRPTTPPQSSIYPTAPADERTAFPTIRRSATPIPTPRPTACPWSTTWEEVSPEDFVPCGTLREEHAFQSYVVRVYVDESTPPPHQPAAFEIARDGQRLYAQYGTSHLQVGRFWVQGEEGWEEMRIPMGRDITGDGIPNLIVYDYAGGAYCCIWLDIFALGEPFRYIGRIFPGEYAPIVTDRDDDGNLEFTILDTTFRNYREWPHVSGAYLKPLVTLHYADEGYQVALDLMRRPAPSLEEMEEAAQPLRDEEGWQHRTELSFWQVVLDLIYSGHADLVEPFLEMVWPDQPAKREGTLDMLRESLPSSPYWAELRALNPHWPWLEE